MTEAKDQEAVTPAVAPAFSDEEIEAGRVLFARPCVFLKGVVGLPHLPPPDRVEIAFAGRSNVGKSSLVNALTGRKTLARTSNTPGRTQELNFFTLGETPGPELYLVDLPGYGYARVANSKVDAWTRLIKDYLRGRPTLRRAFLLIDARHGVKENDREIMKLLDTAAVSYQIVLTKLDKLNRAKQEKIVTDTAATVRKFVACHPHICATSAEKGWGIPELRAGIYGLASGG